MNSSKAVYLNLFSKNILKLCISNVFENFSNFIYLYIWNKKMKFLVMPDSFKGSLLSKQVCNSIKLGIETVFENAEIEKIPISDGGEGFVESLVSATNGTIIKIFATNPLGDKVKSFYGVLGDRKTVVIEMSAASGIQLLTNKKKAPFITTTFGTGELIQDALNRGFRKIIIGIGGSATIDGGAGMLQALGVKFFDSNSKLINGFMNNQKLGLVNNISIENFHSAIKETSFTLACDVENVLLGEEGSVYIYGLQKGAKKKDLPLLEANIENFYNVVEDFTKYQVRDIKGSGSAGGLGGALISFFDVKKVSGIDLVLDLINFKEKIKDVDFIFTGEGKIDIQTTYGKVIYGILKIVNKKVPVIALAGQIDNNIDVLYDLGLTSSFSIYDKPMTLKDSFGDVENLITKQTIQICRLIKSIRE